jgi:hypothetical protein
VVLFQKLWFIFGGAMPLFLFVYCLFSLVGLPGVFGQPLFVFLGHCRWFCLAAIASFSQYCLAGRSILPIVWILEGSLVTLLGLA